MARSFSATTTAWILWFLMYVSVGTRGEIVVANVTKSMSEKKVDISRNETNSVKVTTTRSEPTSLREDFVPPKAISISADADVSNVEPGYTILPLPPSFRYPVNDGLEETFTYQVKKQGRPPKSAPLELQDEYNLLHQRATRQSFEAMQHLVNDIDEGMTMKIQNISTRVSALSNVMIGNISAVTSAWDQLNQDVVNLTKMSKETSRLVKIMQFSQEQQFNKNKALMEQVSNLTGELANLRNEKSEDMAKILATLTSFQTKLENTTHDIRVHESHLRYGQQVMTTIRESVNQNMDRITGLESDGEPQWTEQTVGCGGVVIANSGIISYKFRQPYLNNERCVWIIRANRKTKINLQLLEDGFQNQSNTDFLTVTEFSEEQQLVTLITSSRLEHGNNALHTFQGPVIFVTFYSDATIPGTGFTLKFTGVGNRTDAASTNAVRHLNMHFSAPIGVFTYPNDNTVTYQPNELVTIAINPTNTNLLKVFMKRSDLEKDEYCEFDSVNFYGSVTGSYALTKRYCQQGENYTAEMIQSSDGIFLVIFKSDPSTQFSGFQFMWEIE